MNAINKVFIRPLQYLGLLLSYLTPRNRSLWCFGSSFTGNAKYLFIYMSQHTEHKCVWISGNKETDYLRGLGLNAYNRSSLRGIYYLLTAGVYVFNSYVANVNLYTMGRAKRVNLWHGVGLKNIEYKIKVGPIAQRYYAKGPLNYLRYLNFRVKPDVFLSTSPMMTTHFSECFEISTKSIIEGIYPRCEILTKNKDFVDKFIASYENEECKCLVDHIKRFSYTYIYMPTFRDNGKDFLKGFGFDLNILNDTLKRQNRLMILKLHPDTKIDLDGDYSNLILMGKDLDLYPVLPFTDCLITDYSSIYFDYILMKDKHVILFVPDYSEYINCSRDLAFSYDEYTKGIRVNTFNELISVIEQSYRLIEMPNVEKIRETFWNPKYKSMSQLVDGIDLMLSN